MITSETLFVIILILTIIVIYLKKIYLEKEIDKEIINTLNKIENNREYADQIASIKQSIDDENLKSYKSKIEEYENYFIKDAIRRSGSVSKGKVLEHFSPYLLSSEVNPNELVFMGNPIDFISFTNIDSNSKPLSIDFIEIKTGNSKMTKKQKLIQRAIENNEVYYKKIHLEK